MWLYVLLRWRRTVKVGCDSAIHLTGQCGLRQIIALTLKFEPAELLAMHFYPHRNRQFSVTKQQPTTPTWLPREDQLDVVQSSVDGRTVVRAVDTGWQQQTCCCQRCAISNCCYSRCSFVSSRWRPLIAWFRSTVFARRRPSSVRRRTPGWSRRTARRSSTAPRTALSTTTASASTTTIRVRSVSSSCRPSSVSRSHRAGPSTKWVLHDLIRVNLLISEMLKQACYSRSFAAVSLSQFSPISQHCAYSWRVTKLSNNMALDIPVKTSVYSWSSS